MSGFFVAHVRNPNSHSRMIIGIGIPISQSNPPRIMMCASMVVSPVNEWARLSFRYREAQ